MGSIVRLFFNGFFLMTNAPHYFIGDAYAERLGDYMAPGERGAPSLRAPLRQPRARFSMVVLIGAVLAPAFVVWMSWTCFIGAHRSWQQSPSPDSSVTRHFMNMQDRPDAT